MQVHSSEDINSLAQSRGQTWPKSEILGQAVGQEYGQTQLSKPQAQDRPVVPPAVDMVDFTPKDNAELGKLPANYQQQKPLASREGVVPAGPPTKVKRHDSNTNEVDEFVDAES